MKKIEIENPAACVWEETRPADFPRFPKLPGDLRTDVLVVGGGIAGLLTAYELQRHGVECVLVERGRICGGVISKTTAKITAQHRLIYGEIAESYGLEAAEMYLAANLRAVEKFAALSRKFKCDYKTSDSFVYSRSRRDVLEREASVLQQLHYHADICDSPPLPFKTAGALRFPNQGELHPLKFLGEIAKTLTIYENTTVNDIRGNVAFTENGEIHARRFVIATHFPFIDRVGCYFLKMYQSRSSVLALRNAQKLSGYYVDENKGGLSFRQYGDLLLLGGGAHRTGKPCKPDKLVQFAQRAYPGCEIACSWSAQDCITLDGIPYIGHYGLIKSNLLVITGFNKWGMTSAMAGAEIIRDLVLEKENRCAEVFNPRRTIFHKQLLINGINAVKDLAAPTAPRCAHMGCALKYNSAEHSWDCPCHGSRYSQSGALLEGPANHGLNLDLDPDKLNPDNTGNSGDQRA